MGGACGTNGGERNMCMLLVEKPEGNSSLGRPRRRRRLGAGVELLEMR
jgi:hypothetical protein